MAKKFLVPVILAEGTVGAPGLYFGTDTTTGLYRVGANSIGVAVSGVNELTVDGNGLSVAKSVIIGTGGAGGQLYLNGATLNRIDWNTNGVAAPAFTTRSAGTKLVLYPNVAGAAVDYAIGIESGCMWHSVATTSQTFKWYGGVTQAMSLTGAGVMSLAGTLTLTGTTKTAGHFYAGTTSPTNSNRLNYDGSLYATAFAGHGADLTNMPVVNGFRLSLTSGVPVTTADVTGATTIYCTPYTGEFMSVIVGSNWVLRASPEFSLALGTLTSGKPYDVFCYDNAGTLTLEILAWTNDTTRATGIDLAEGGIYLKTGDITRRYLGTFYTTSTTTTEDSDTKRYLWNYYNRVARRMFKTDSTYSWTYSTSSFRQANNSTANQINYVQGVSEDAIQATVHGSATTSAATIRAAISAIGLDTTTAMSSSSFGGLTYLPNNLIMGMTCTYSAHTAAGRHFLAWLEYGGGGDTQTWYCNSINGGIRGVILG